MRRTVRVALMAGGVALLGFAVAPAVATVHGGPAVVGPSPVVVEVRDDGGAKARVCDDVGSMAGLMGRGGQQMAAMHRAHHGGGAVESGQMRAMHRAHHGEGAAPGDGMMGSGGTGT